MQITLDFPGDGVRNVRIDTTVKVRHLTAAPPERIIGELVRNAVTTQLSNIYTSGGGSKESAESAERVVILREVLPDGTEGSAVRFDQAALDDLPKIFEKVRNGRYRVYLFEPATQSLRLVMEIDVREGKPTTPERNPEADDAAQPAGDASAATFDATVPPVAADLGDTADSKESAHVSTAAVVAGAGLVLAGGGDWTERVDAAVAKFRKHSRLRSTPPPRRKLPR
ncbi:MAG: hypothetical protein QM775_03175 [Pirellulales bacterium]